MTEPEFWAAIDAAPADLYVQARRVDWGRRQKGQGRRRGGMVMGAMSDAPTGVRTYHDLLGSAPLTDTDRQEAAGLEKGQQAMLARALAAGFQASTAFLVAYSVGPDPIPRATIYELVVASNGG